jgi:hypothetical protein
VAYHVGHLVELAVVHLKKGVEDPPLHRLEAVFQIRNRPILDNIGRVFEKIFIE